MYILKEFFKKICYSQLYLQASLLIHVNSSVVTLMSESSLCNAGMRIVENPKVEPKVSRSKFLAPTAQHCGTACRSLEMYATSTGVLSSFLKCT